MAKELRWENLVTAIGDGTTSGNSVAEFRNDASVILHIRDLWASISAGTLGIDESVHVELSKSPVFASTTQNGVFWAWNQRLGSDGSGDGEVTWNGGRKYGKGQLTLEQNESVFTNAVKTSGGILAANHVIGFHY